MTKTHFLPRLALHITNHLLTLAHNRINHLLRLSPRLLRLDDARASACFGLRGGGAGLGGVGCCGLGLGRDGVLDGLDDAGLGIS